MPANPLSKSPYLSERGTIDIRYQPCPLPTLVPQVLITSYQKNKYTHISITDCLPLEGLLTKQRNSNLFRDTLSPPLCSRSVQPYILGQTHTRAYTQTYTRIHTHTHTLTPKSHQLVTMARSSTSACAAKCPVNTMHMHTCGNCGTEYTTGSCWYCHPQNRAQIGSVTA
ncbi:hypothetical protein GGR55DRAFT_672167 [Xylaria sp. FL0064]|nr:hypothetical protein GGR55DRAFT_672167 [Xylaria sp. FL0064]